MKLQWATSEYEGLNCIPTTQNPRFRAEVPNKHHLLGKVHPGWWMATLCVELGSIKGMFSGLNVAIRYRF